jgi:hypothetical protein
MAGSARLTIEYNIYNFAAGAGYQHRTVNHGAGEYARHDPDGVCVHCNTMDGVAFHLLDNRQLLAPNGPPASPYSFNSLLLMSVSKKST